MHVEQLVFDAGSWRHRNSATVKSPQLVLAFLSPGMDDAAAAFEKLRGQFSRAHVVGCTTGGEILDDEVFDNAGVALAVEFEGATISVANIAHSQYPNSFEAGIALGEKLASDNLRGVFVLSDGVLVNGTQLVRGLRERFGDQVSITGGLAGDRADFRETLVGADDRLQPDRVAAIGFYGSLQIQHGSNGGWDAFGPQRWITKSAGNVLYELDGNPALDLYKRYLGDEAKQLPGSALLYPLKVYKAGQENNYLVRTIISIDESAKSMTFAGEMPQGSMAQLMVGHFDRLINGAGNAVKAIAANRENSFAILVSCIGRKLLLGQRAFEEAQEVHERLGKMPQIGFYSYGEISPHSLSGLCELHNQTMTVSVFTEH